MSAIPIGLTPPNTPTHIPISDDLEILFTIFEDVKQDIRDNDYKLALESIGRLREHQVEPSSSMAPDSPSLVTQSLVYSCYPDGCSHHSGRLLPFKLEKIELYCSSKRSKPSVMNHVLSSLGRDYTVTYCCKKDVI